MKKQLSIIGLTCLLSLTIPTEAFATSKAVTASKIALIDLHQIIRQLPQQQEFARQLEAEINGRNSELQLIERRIIEKQKKLERDAAIMKPSERTTIEKEIVSLGEQRAGKAQQYDQELQQRQIEVGEKLMQQIQQATQRLAKQKGYEMVLDARIAIYPGQASDVTQEIIGILKK
ncbi:MAG: OmpH family outer membrane protein [Candidatus Symbiodolus clandestinus]